MANELSVFARLSISKTGFVSGSGDVNLSLDSADPDAIVITQDLAADTVEALDVGDVELPCGKLLVKMITPAAGGEIQISLQSGGTFDANRFASLSKQGDFAVWTPKLGTAIYVKSIGAAGRIQVVAG